MGITTTLYRGSNTRWAININEKKRGDVISPIIREYDDGSLIYDPLISLGITQYVDKTRSYIRIPLNAIYGMEQMLSIVYTKIVENPSMYINIGGDLKLDHELVKKASRRLILYRSNVIVSPTIIYTEDENHKGMKIIDGDTIIPIKLIEIKEVCEILHRLDISSFGIMNAVLDKVISIEKTVDNMYTMQHRILQLLTSQRYAGPVKEVKDDNHLDWGILTGSTLQGNIIDILEGETPHESTKY